MGDVAEDEEITLQEALEEQELLEKTSAAVLGGSDPQNCSYSKGYMKRQALYACLTCNPKGAPFSQPGGICLACSYTCHEGHELVELFTKRNFRCDCGNKKFPDNPCRLLAEKDDVNAENAYNQNFIGMYCSCQRPYPDPECKSELADDSMIQCIICEDWLHSLHCLKYLNMDIEAMDEDHELICGPCMSRLDFLGHYSELAVKPKPVNVEHVEDAKVTVDEGKAAGDAGNSENSAKVTVDEGNAAGDAGNSAKISVEKIEEHVEETSKDSGVDCAHGAEASSPPVPVCPVLTKAKEVLPFSDVNAVIWKDSFRSMLCRCSTCMAMYKTLQIEYLLDDEDTIGHYEALGKKNAEVLKLSAETSINNQMNQLGRVGQLEFIHGYNQFKEQLADFLKGHAEKGTVVQREDVNNFFAKMNEEQIAKRRRLE